MGMGRQTVFTVPVDKEKLAAVLKQRGVTMGCASAEIGFNTTYLCVTSKRGLLPKYVANLLKMKFNIDESDYSPYPTEAETEPMPASDEIAKRIDAFGDTIVDALPIDDVTEELKQQRGAIIANGEVLEALLTAVRELTTEVHNASVNQMKFYKAWENFKKYGHF